MKIVRRYPIEYRESQTLQLPKGAKVLTVEKQGPFRYLCALADAKANLEPRTFVMCAVGDARPDRPSLIYLGTFDLAAARHCQLFETR